MIAWVVMGSTGEYSDHHMWLVVAYSSEEQAKRHADAATARALELSKRCAHDDRLDEECTPCGRTFDPDIFFGVESYQKWMGDLDKAATHYVSYTGADYVALPVEMRA